MKTICLILLLLTYAVYSQSRSRRTEMAMETYAFLEGQRYALKQFEDRFPEFKSEALVLEYQSEKVFWRSLYNTDRILRNETNPQSYLDFKTGLATMLKSWFENAVKNPQDATLFLEEIADRLEGNMDPMIWQQILAFAYQDEPTMEWKQGYYKTFDLTGNIQSGTGLKIAIPLSWSQTVECPE